MGVACCSSDVCQQLHDLPHQGDHVGVEVDHAFKEGAVKVPPEEVALEGAKRAGQTIQDGEEFFEVFRKGGIGVNRTYD